MIGENLKRYRELNGYSQPDLSKKTGVSHSTISRIEHNQINSPSYDILVKLARALKITLSELTGEAVKHQPESAEQILERLRLATPIAIPIYTDYPIRAGDGVEPVEYIYRAPQTRARGNIEGYLVKGNCLSPVINNGDIIVLDRDAPFDLGGIVACVYREELHLGRLTKVDNELWLTNSHRSFKFEECAVAARVIEVIRRL